MKADRLAEQKSTRYDTKKETAVARRTGKVLLREDVEPVGDGGEKVQEGKTIPGWQ